MTKNEPMLEQVLKALHASRGRWAEVSEGSGVPYHTLTKIAQGVNANPRVLTVQRLHDYFSAAGNDPHMSRAA